MNWSPIAAALATCLSCTPALAGDVVPVNDSVTFSAETGLMNIEANELVYGGGKRLSQLVWKSKGIVLIGGVIRVDIDKDWHVKAQGHMGFGGNGHMVDSDWIAPFAPGTGDNQWSDRSIHPDTRLTHYFDVDLAVGRTMIARNDLEAGLLAGFSYTDVRWSAFGGSFTYSGAGFRDLTGHFPANSKGISYDYMLPVAYVGAEFKRQFGDLTIEGTAKAGLAIMASDRDDHWQRSLLFRDYFDIAPDVSFKLAADYAIKPNISLYLSGSFDKMFRVRGDTTMKDTITGAKSRFNNGAGGDYQSMAIGFGVKGTF